MPNFEPYDPRPVEFIDQINVEDWRLKVYGISAKSEPIPKELVLQGINTVSSFLPQPALTEQRYGVGFLIIHQGTMRNWLLLEWWENEDILHHRLFSSPLDDPLSITPEPDKSLIACVHELRVINFESLAWIKTVLCKEDKPSIEKYLDLKFDSQDENS